MKIEFSLKVKEKEKGKKRNIHRMAENVHLETQNWLESLIYIALESEANAKHPKWNFNGTFNGENSASPKEQ